LISVDLPAPFSPSSAKTSPGSSDSETSRNAVVPPKRFVIFSKLSKDGATLQPSRLHLFCSINVIDNIGKQRPPKSQ
jgi:hypothetical protein